MNSVTTTCFGLYGHLQVCKENILHTWRWPYRPKHVVWPHTKNCKTIYNKAARRRQLNLKSYCGVMLKRILFRFGNRRYRKWGLHHETWKSRNQREEKKIGKSIVKQTGAQQERRVQLDYLSSMACWPPDWPDGSITGAVNKYSRHHSNESHSDKVSAQNAAVAEKLTNCTSWQVTSRKRNLWSDQTTSEVVGEFICCKVNWFGGMPQ
jgi:hypothetical protein